jgi:hypothetical protein
MKRPEFGQRVTIRAFMKRYARWDYTKGYLAGHDWKRIELDAETKAIYIGYRTVYDGTIIHNYGEDNEFKRDTSHRVYLVVTNERTNPIRVLPEDVECNAERKVTESDVYVFNPGTADRENCKHQYVGMIDGVFRCVQCGVEIPVDPPCASKK